MQNASVSTPATRPSPTTRTGQLNWLRLRAGALAAGAGLQATVRRARLGARLPGWTRRTELAVAMEKRIVRFLSARDPRYLQALTREPLIPLSEEAAAARVVPVWDAPMAAEWHQPPGIATDGDSPIVLYLHGGGYVFGSPAGTRELTARLAIGAGARVLSVDYRLAPQHPFPAALDDAYAAWAWLLESRIRPSRVVLAGDSAGGGLALALMLRLRDEGAPLPSAAALVCPWVDLQCTSASLARNAPTDILEPWMLRSWSALYRSGQDARHPYISPVQGDLRGMPPLLVHAGGAETLRDEAEWLAQRARDAGAEVNLRVYDDMFHDWHFLARLVPEGGRAIEELVRFVRKHAGD